MLANVSKSLYLKDKEKERLEWRGKEVSIATVLADDLMEFDSRKWWTYLLFHHGVYSAVLPLETDFLSCYRLMLNRENWCGGGRGGGVVGQKFREA